MYSFVKFLFGIMTLSYAVGCPRQLRINLQTVIQKKSPTDNPASDLFRDNTDRLF